MLLQNYRRAKQSLVFHENRNNFGLELMPGCSPEKKCPNCSETEWYPRWLADTSSDTVTNHINSPLVLENDDGASTTDEVKTMSNEDMVVVV